MGLITIKIAISWDGGSIKLLIIMDDYVSRLEKQAV
jgi:hypothetical protein